MSNCRQGPLWRCEAFNSFALRICKFVRPCPSPTSAEGSADRIGRVDIPFRSGDGTGALFPDYVFTVDVRQRFGAVGSLCRYRLDAGREMECHERPAFRTCGCITPGSFAGRSTAGLRPAVRGNKKRRDAKFP